MKNSKLETIETAANKEPEYLKYIDIRLLNDLMSKIATATGMGIAACDYTGVPVAGAEGYCKFCRCVQENVESRRSCEASTAIGEIQSATTHKPYIYVCPHGLLEVSIPINVNGKFMGGIVAGQVYCEDIPESVTKVASIFPSEVLCAEKYSEEMKNCTQMSFEEFNATAQMIYAMLTELFKATVTLEMDHGEVADIIEENRKLKAEIKELKSAGFNNIAGTSFLTSSLSSIANTAAIEGAVETNELIGILSEFVNELMSQKSDTNFLCDEMRIVEQYLELHKRKLDELEFEINIPEELKLYRIPLMFIYPIVEFSVYCELMYKPGKKDIKISVEEKGEQVLITVEDNGLGMKYEEVRALFPQIVEEYNLAEDNNNAIQTLKNRLDLIFGSEYEMGAAFDRGRGTKYVLKIPSSFAKGDEV